MRYLDYNYDPETDEWVHPVTGVAIKDDEMPWELTPEEGK